jgi:hypothetical protein
MQDPFLKIIFYNLFMFLLSCRSELVRLKPDIKTSVGDSTPTEATGSHPRLQSRESYDTIKRAGDISIIVQYYTGIKYRLELD